MQAADEIGVRIPRLCYHPKLSILGACRICIVEVEGIVQSRGVLYPSSRQWQKVRTSSPLLRRLRRDIVELILDNHPKDCQTLGPQSQL